MKITIFTSNHSRHNYLVNSMSEICDDVYVIQENRSLFPGTDNSFYHKSKIIEKYFQYVKHAENIIFKKNHIEQKKANINILPIAFGDLQKIAFNDLKKFLQSDFYIIFGASFIKGELIDFLINKKAINIHMGISPYYRGTDCNFWALHDNNPHLVGSTIHLLDKNLDSGKILYHAISANKKDPFEYTMNSVKAAIESIKCKIENKTLFSHSLMTQDRNLEIRYSKKRDFNEKEISKFFLRENNQESRQNLDNYLKDLFILK